MSYGSILNQAPVDLRRILRTKEGILRKMINKKWSIIYNEKCIKENLVPKFSNFIFKDVFKSLFYLLV